MGVVAPGEKKYPSTCLEELRTTDENFSGGQTKYEPRSKPGTSKT